MDNPYNFSLMVHGGAGELEQTIDDKVAVRYLEGVRGTLEHGRRILETGGSALEAVEQCVSMLEDDPVFNAGAGSVLNEDGKVEMDAAIMCGATLFAGSVAGISNIANPVQLARVILAEGGHVMLVGQGAQRFAEQRRFERMPDTYFMTPERLAEWQQAKRSPNAALDPGHARVAGDDKYGTVGAVARDKYGNLAAATSTGGVANKRSGRVGDSPILGAGVYADNDSCAVSCTGFGEDFMRTAMAKTLSDLIEFKRLDGPAAAREGVDYLLRKVNGRGGFIVVDNQGRCASAYTTGKMVHGWIERGRETFCRL